MNSLDKISVERLHVLIIEDSEDDAQLLVAEFQKKEYDLVFQRVTNAESLKSALSSQQWDLVISDEILPQFNGTDALIICHQFDRDLPFIIVSGAIREETAVEAMRAGAEDYLMKGDILRLIPAVERALRDAQTRKQHRLALLAFEESEARFKAIASNTPQFNFEFRRFGPRHRQIT